MKDCISPRNQTALAEIRYWDAGAPAYRWRWSAQRFTTQLSPPGIPNRLTTASIPAISIQPCHRLWQCREVPPIRPSMRSPPAQPPPFSDIFSPIRLRRSKTSPMKRQLRVSWRASHFQATCSRGSIWEHGWAAIAYAKLDGSDQVFSGSFPPSPGTWSSTNPVSPLGAWRPWVLTSAKDLRLGPPPAPGRRPSRAISTRTRRAPQELTRSRPSRSMTQHWRVGTRSTLISSSAQARPTRRSPRSSPIHSIPDIRPAMHARPAPPAQ